MARSDLAIFHMNLRKAPSTAVKKIAMTPTARFAAAVVGDVGSTRHAGQASKVVSSIP
jgi:hypothetical protein